VCVCVFVYVCVCVNTGCFPRGARNFRILVYEYFWFKKFNLCRTAERDVASNTLMFHDTAPYCTVWFFMNHLHTRSHCSQTILRSNYVWDRRNCTNSIVEIILNCFQCEVPSIWRIFTIIRSKLVFFSLKWLK